jgi:hypothetical protein
MGETTRTRTSIKAKRVDNPLYIHPRHRLSASAKERSGGSLQQSKQTDKSPKDKDKGGDLAKSTDPHVEAHDSGELLQSPFTVHLSLSELHKPLSTSTTHTPPHTVTLSFEQITDLLKQTETNMVTNEDKRIEAEEKGENEGDPEFNEGENDNHHLTIVNKNQTVGEKGEHSWSLGLNQLVSLSLSDSQRIQRHADTNTRVRGRGTCRFGVLDGIDNHGESEEDNSNDSNNNHNNKCEIQEEYNPSTSPKHVHQNITPTNDLSNDHILEIFSFPSTTTTSDLEQWFADYKGLVRFKWIHDTAALAIFRSAVFALDALRTISTPTAIMSSTPICGFKIRFFVEASVEAKAMAQKIGGTAGGQSTPRPYKTSTTVARRLIANALGQNIIVSSKSRPTKCSGEEDV